VQELTKGAACTALLAERFIDNDEDLLIANSDQYVVFNQKNFETMRRHCNKADGLVFTFNAIHPKWSFVKTNESGEVIKVEEKNPISDIATCGIYWYRKGSDFVRYAHRMIEKNIRTNNEFYIAPVYNEMLLDNKTIFPFFVEKMWGLGTPEDLDSFLRNFIG
jgi:dTDP-glucose pyrophosphorylase